MNIFGQNNVLFPSKGKLGQGEFKGSKTKEAAIYFVCARTRTYELCKEKKKSCYLLMSDSI
jgi:hypothetical protein